MIQDELRRYTIPVKYNGMIIGGDIVEYPKTINVTAICIDARSGETGLACTTDKRRREYTDLSQLWHYKDQEPPEIGRYILADTPQCGILLMFTHTREFADKFGNYRYAYVDDLKPGGGW